MDSCGERVRGSSWVYESFESTVFLSAFCFCFFLAVFYFAYVAHPNWTIARPVVHLQLYYRVDHIVIGKLAFRLDDMNKGCSLGLNFEAVFFIQC